MRRNVIALSVVGLLCAGAVSVYAWRWPLVNAAIRREFREIEPITTAELAAWLADDTRVAPLLLDVRTRAEYEVSHLRGAVYFGPGTAFDIAKEPRDRPIVAYCSIGYRSGRLARTLRAASFTNVRNLQGSIFEWANEGRPVFRSAERVTAVHPYNSAWAVFLDPKYRARMPAH
jgi:rhodanese-related sulfurtransferase